MVEGAWGLLGGPLRRLVVGVGSRDDLDHRRPLLRDSLLLSQDLLELELLLHLAGVSLLLKLMAVLSMLLGASHPIFWLPHLQNFFSVLDLNTIPYRARLLFEYRFNILSFLSKFLWRNNRSFGGRILS